MGQLLQAARLERYGRNSLVIDGPGVSRIRRVQFLTDLARAASGAELAKPGLDDQYLPPQSAALVPRPTWTGAINGSEGSTEVRSLARGANRGARPATAGRLARRH
jgi:hypothetical protein